MQLISLLALLPIVSALPTPQDQQPAPLKRAVEIPRAVASAPNSFIISLKPGSVDPTGRAEWLTAVLASLTADAQEKDNLGGILSSILGGLNRISNSGRNRGQRQQGFNRNLNHHDKKSDESTWKLNWDEKIFNGFSGSFSDEEIELLRAQEEVAYIQEDLLLQVQAPVTQTNAPWGLSRLSSISPQPAGSNPLTLNYTYNFDSSGGEGVDIYALDTGVRSTHQDFGGRAIFLQTFGSGSVGEDINGHGSHVSATAVGSVFGVAKSATLQMIKCTDDQGAATTADIISAINLAATNAQSIGRPSVISMSITGAANQAIDDAVTNAVNVGVPVIVAAGNEGRDASTDSPARLGGPGGNPGVITVGASTIDDEVASFSNFGPTVDIFAPGADVMSVGVETDTAVNRLSGTSMATPHIAGIAALVMGIEGKLSPAALKTRLVQLAVSGVLSSVPQGTSSLIGSTINGI